MSFTYEKVEGEKKKVSEFIHKVGLKNKIMYFKKVLVKKKVWVDLDKDIKAVLVQKDGIERVYMITEAASAEYQALTGHERMPGLVEDKGKKNKSLTLLFIF